MKITIHRGTDQIGGSVTEYEYDGWRLFVDYGEELSGSKSKGRLEIEGLTHGDVSKSALLITHYHGDHIGCIPELPESLPIFMGKTGRDIQMKHSERLQHRVDAHKLMLKRMEEAHTFLPGKAFEFGPFTIMPITVDHSAFDAYAFRIEADGLKVFHTGDFRTHGFRSAKLPKLIKDYVGQVDYVVCEATNVSRPDATNVSEHDLQLQFIEQFKEHRGNVVYLSSTNVDRLFALYHAALKTDRVFLVDEYQKDIMDIVTKRDTLWGKSRLYQYGKHDPCRLEMGFWNSEKFMQLLRDKGFVLIARTSPLFNNFIDKLPGPKHNYLSMWKGYVKPENEAYNPALAEALGDEWQYLHTSGHCDMDSLRGLISMLNPRAIIPIHTDNPKKFAELFSDEWPVLLLNDGESISPISEHVADTTWARIVCSKTEGKFLGSFRTEEDARFLISHIAFRPDQLLDYEISEEEDLLSKKKASGPMYFK